MGPDLTPKVIRKTQSNLVGWYYFYKLTSDPVGQPIMRKSLASRRNDALPRAAIARK